MLNSPVVEAAGQHQHKSFNSFSVTECHLERPLQCFYSLLFILSVVKRPPNFLVLFIWEPPVFFSRVPRFTLNCLFQNTVTVFLICTILFLYQVVDWLSVRTLRSTGR
jgi:hypothetical protein